MESSQIELTSFQISQLESFIKANPNGKELKRALAVKLALEDYPYRQIGEILKVSIGFISKWKNNFVEEGIEGLKSRHKGSQGYLTPEQKKEVIDWISQKDSRNVEEVEYYIAEKYDVIFQSKQSYYALLKLAGMSWQKSQKKILKPILSWSRKRK